MYLPILLIIITALVFYNEIDLKKMQYGEIALLLIIFMAIVIAAVNYMKITSKYKEGFTSSKNNLPSTTSDDSLNTRIGYGSHYDNSLVKVMDHELKDQVKMQDVQEQANAQRSAPTQSNTIDITSYKDGEYLDPDTENNTVLNKNAPFKRVAPFNNINSSHVAAANQLLKGNLNLNTVEKFNDDKNEENIRSMFVPKMVIGENDENNKGQSKCTRATKKHHSSTDEYSWDNSYNNNNDGFTFNNTMEPVINLWGNDDENTKKSCNTTENWDQGNNWSKGLSAYNKGKWAADMYLKPSDWANSPQGSPTSEGKTRETATTHKSNFYDIPAPVPTHAATANGKMCGAYDDLNLATDKSGNILIGNYNKAKKFVPGYTYIPPVYWDVPQRHTPVCGQADLNVRKLTGLMDRGTPINALELNQDGSLADTEEEVSLTNVGSLMPKFNYYEVPFSQPYS